MFDVTKTNLFYNKSLAVEVVPTFHPQKGIRVALFWSRTIHFVVLFPPITSALNRPLFNFATELVTIPVKHQLPVRYDSMRWDKRRVPKESAQLHGIFDISLSISSKKNLAQVQKRILHKFKKESCWSSKKNIAQFNEICDIMSRISTSLKKDLTQFHGIFDISHMHMQEFHWNVQDNYRPQTKLRKGNFSQACVKNSVHGGGQDSHCSGRYAFFL